MRTIGLIPGTSPGVRRTLDLLAEHLHVRFEERSPNDHRGLHAWLLPETDAKSLRRIARGGRPCYAVLQRDLLVDCGASAQVDFSRDAALPAPLCGRSLAVQEAAVLRALPAEFSGPGVVASKAAAPLWRVERTGRSFRHIVSLPLPESAPGAPLFERFCPASFLQLLPLLVFLRTVAGEPGWQAPPLYACLMFDDPNLHWRTYGHLDFERTALHARLHNYHVSFATIPLDAWFVHRPTALLFRRHRGQLSLLIHGTDHRARELALSCSDDELDTKLRTALTQVGALERKAWLEVARVMAPPHGACSERTLAMLAGLGFEAASVSRGSLRFYNSAAPWVRTLGMGPVDVIAGLPVLSRFSLSAADRDLHMLLAAVLDQPVIAMGHHRDVAGGLDDLARAAQFINSLGSVRWAGMSEIARSRYASRLEGNTLQIRMLTRRIGLTVPEDVTRVLVERAGPAAEQPLAWRRQGAAWAPYRSGEPLPVVPGEAFEVAEPAVLPGPGPAGRSAPVGVWPVVRRQLTEARDRLSPLVTKLATLASRAL